MEKYKLKKEKVMNNSYLIDVFKPVKKIYVHFRKKEDIFEFAKLINQKVTLNTKRIYYRNPKETK